MEDRAKQYQKLIAKCWADEAFKKKLLADPAGTLKAEGFEIRPGVSVNVVENTAQSITFVIPTVPKDLTDEDLATVSAGTANSGTFCCCCCSG